MRIRLWIVLLAAIVMAGCKSTPVIPTGPAPQPTMEPAMLQLCDLNGDGVGDKMDYHLWSQSRYAGEWANWCAKAIGASNWKAKQ